MELAIDLRDGTVAVPVPPEGIGEWPVIGQPLPRPTIGDRGRAKGFLAQGRAHQILCSGMYVALVVEHHHHRQSRLPTIEPLRPKPAQRPGMAGEGMARDLPVVGRWKSKEGDVFYLAFGAICDRDGNPIANEEME